MTRISTLVVYLVAIILLSSCGGDDIKDLESNSARTIDSGYVLKVTLVNSVDSLGTTSISSSAPGNLLISLTRYDDPIQSGIINVSTTEGVLSPSNGAVLTNDAGQTSIRLSPNNQEGAGTVTARYFSEDLNRNVSVSLNFFISEISATIESELVVSLSFSGTATAANTIRGDAPGTATARVTDDSGEPLTNTLVTFSVTNLALSPSSGQVLTDSQGLATINVLASGFIGVGSITASVNQSDAIYSATTNVSIESPNIDFGYSDGVTFTEGILGLTNTTLSAGGTTSITASIIDEDGALFDEPVSVSFSSPCAVATRASLDASVSTNTGSATATYRANGCVGTDRITATLDFAGTVFTAFVDVTVSDDSAGSIVFLEASPQTIVIQGTGTQGLLESSTVSFRVLGVRGEPLANQQVDFELTSTVGGIELDPISATSDAEGRVFTTVSSGSVSTSVVVRATLTDENISTQSTQLVVSTGVPDQDSTTISVSQLNPEAWHYDGEEITVTVRAADQFNNLVPDGIGFTFTTEGGAINPSCSTINGSCSVTWVAQNPKPANGLATIMVTATGGESFQDENGNGVFDDGDILSDLSEAFRDDNSNGIRDAGEPYVDYNVNGVFDSANGLYDGPTCADSARCASATGVTVRDSIVIAMSGSFANVTFTPDDSNTYTSGSNIRVVFSDLNGNSLPGGTEISITSEIGTLVGESQYIVPNTIAPLGINFSVLRASTENFDVVTFTTTTPNGDESVDTYSINYVP